MIIRTLQGSNPIDGFTCAVEDSATKKVVGFLYQVDDDVWQTHYREEFSDRTIAARHLLGEYLLLRSHPLAKPMKFETISWFFQLFHKGYDVNKLSDSELELATFVLDQSKYVVYPKLKFHYWQPLKNDFWYIKIWDEANFWLKPRFTKFLVASHSEAHRFACQIYGVTGKIHFESVSYLSNL
ncbi:MAG: hypothetical protein ICV85_07030 [Tolypothrix sp. T3-bin4]|nr:hypothetical protein [Tolypothrix sp. T3-bin4]